MVGHGRETRESTGMAEFVLLLKHLRALPEAAMRRRVLAERLEEMNPERVLDFFDAVLAGVGRRSHLHLVALDAVHDVVLAGQAQAALYELLADVYWLAQQRGLERVARLLLNARPQRGPVESDETPGDHQLSKLSLGERKYLARGHDRVRLGRLLIDPEPSVIRNILQNPKLTEQEVVWLAARRPVRSEILWQVFRSRWMERYRVQLALVCNPYTPTELSLKLVGFLLRPDLVAVAKNTSLHPLVRGEANRLCPQRGPRGAGKRERRPREARGGESFDPDL